MKIIVNCNMLRKRISKLIENSNKFVVWYLFSIEIDDQMRTILQKKLNQGIKITIYYSLIHSNYVIPDIKHDNFQCIPISKSYRGNIPGELTILKNITNCGNDHVFGLHSRVIYNETHMIVNGVNYSSRYSGTCHLNKINEFKWYEHGLYFQYSTVQSHPIELRGESISVSESVDLISSNQIQYDLILRHIKNATHSIYIENQYFISAPETYNKISEYLSNRINDAIKQKQDFRLTLILNEFNQDESLIPMLCIRTMSMYSLYKLREKIKCDDKTFDKFVHIYVPTEESKLVIHSKVYAFDEERILYTSSNIIDRSLHPDGDYECGAFIRNGGKIIEQCKKELPYKLLKRITAFDIGGVDDVYISSFMMKNSLPKSFGYISGVSMI